MVHILTDSLEGLRKVHMETEAMVEFGTGNNYIREIVMVLPNLLYLALGPLQLAPEVTTTH